MTIHIDIHLRLSKVRKVAESRHRKDDLILHSHSADDGEVGLEQFWPSARGSQSTTVGLGSAGTMTQFRLMSKFPRFSRSME